MGHTLGAYVNVLRKINIQSQTNWMWSTLNTVWCCDNAETKPRSTKMEICATFSLDWRLLFRNSMDEDFYFVIILFIMLCAHQCSQPSTSSCCYHRCSRVISAGGVLVDDMYIDIRLRIRRRYIFTVYFVYVNDWM